MRIMKSLPDGILSVTAQIPAWQNKEALQAQQGSGHLD
jgi:hypothetical protein